MPGIGFAKPPVFVDLRDFDVDLAGNNDSTTGITLAVTQAAAAGTTRLGAAVFIPPGSPVITSTITIPRTGNTPTGVVQFVGDNVRSSRIVGSGSNFVARGMFEWAATTDTAWCQRFANLSIIMPDVAGAKAIWHKANQATINGTTWINEILQLDLENVLIECNNEFHEVCIDLEVGARIVTWRNLAADPTRGSGANASQYATLLARTRYEYTAVSVTSIARTSATLATATKVGHGFISNQFVRISGANESAFNGTFRITVTSSSVFTYALASDPGGNATGTLIMYEQPSVGGDSVGFWGRMECIYPMLRRGGWCRLFEGRMYYTTVDTAFINGQRSGHVGHNLALYNSWTTKLINIGFEGSGSDGSAICKVYRGEQVRFDSIHCPVGVNTDSAWAALTAYAIGDRVVPTLLATGGIPATNRYFKCTTLGTSGGSEPAWPTNLGGTVVDGTAVWTAQTPALGNSIEFSQSRGCKINGRLAVNGNPLASGRLVKILSIDAQCYDVICEDFDINTSALVVSSEVEILAPAANGNMIRGRQQQAFTDVREAYQVGTEDLLIGSTTYDPPLLADGAGATTTVTVTGAAMGDFVDVSFSNNTFGMTLTGEVSVAGTVSVRFQNETGSQIDLSSGTLRAQVRKAS